jgi:MYXO-CTERM domain-containing protein
MIASAVRACRTWCARLSVLAVVLLSFSPAPAGAQVMQTNGGGVIPKQPGTTCVSNATICINGNEVVEGGAGDIDAIATATISQETFSPLCELTFKVVARGAGYQNTFGWYAVQRDAAGKALAPMLSDLHVFLGCPDAIGTEKTLSIPKGTTEIGFFLANDESTCVTTTPDPLGPVLTKQPSNLFFSQRDFNSDASGMIHLLVWQSHANPNGFYFGWEDLSGGGDNDFEDLMTYVTGIQCAGGGDPCQIDGEQGVCADGVTQCRDGELTCVANQTKSDEVCNGLDDDCSGEVDDADDLCPKDEICVRGRCEPKCGTGEFRCGADETCVEGVCIEADCAKKKCDAGSVCRGGKCVAPCDGVACPYGQACRSGVCVDVCVGVECDPGFVCEARASTDTDAVVGVCTSCDCRGCDDGQSCVDHLCVTDSCANQTCDAGAHCVDGDCIDNCKDATCPAGQICDAGACIKDPTSGGGGASGNGEGGNGATGNDGGIVIDPGNDGGSDAAGGVSPGSDDGLGNDKVAIEAKGCSCSTPGGNASALGTLGLVGLLLGAARRRARRRRSTDVTRA